MFLKILIVAIFVAVTVAVGVFARKHSNLSLIHISEPPRH